MAQNSKGERHLEAVQAMSIQELVALLAAGEPTAKEKVAKAIAQMTDSRHLESTQIKAAVAAAGGIPSLVQQLTAREATTGLLRWSAAALANLATNCADRQAAILAAGGLRPLVVLLGSSESAVQEIAVWALRCGCLIQAPTHVPETLHLRHGSISLVFPPYHQHLCLTPLPLHRGGLQVRVRQERGKQNSGHQRRGNRTSGLFAPVR